MKGGCWEEYYNENKGTKHRMRQEKIKEALRNELEIEMSR